MPKITGYDLPATYHRSILQMMVRDAHSLFCYWEISNRKKWLVAQHFGRDWAEMPKVLRVYDVTGLYFNGHNANRYFDMETNSSSGNWYIHGVNAGAVYLADYGTYTWERQFVPLIRSNAAATPRDYRASVGEPVIGVVPGAQAEWVPGRIAPSFFENFRSYSKVRSLYCEDGEQVDQPFATAEGIQGLSMHRAACPSALYPPR